MRRIHSAEGYNVRPCTGKKRVQNEKDHVSDGSKSGVENIAYFRVFNLDNKSTINDAEPKSGYWSGWQSASAVPEPTSALLILVGVAGLALRRKRG